MKENNYKEHLYKRLRDPQYAAEYLNAILEKNDTDLFLLGLRDIVHAYGFSDLAKDTGHGRESLYKSLSKGKNPRINTIFDILSVLDCKMVIKPTKKAA